MTERFQSTPFFRPKARRGTDFQNQSLEGQAGPKDRINRLFRMLSVLDTKASGLLRVTSLFLTVLVFLFAHQSG